MKKLLIIISLITLIGCLKETEKHNPEMDAKIASLQKELVQANNSLTSATDENLSLSAKLYSQEKQNYIDAMEYMLAKMNSVLIIQRMAFEKKMARFGYSLSTDTDPLKDIELIFSSPTKHALYLTQAERKTFLYKMVQQVHELHSYSGGSANPDVLPTFVSWVVSSCYELDYENLAILMQEFQHEPLVRNVLIDFTFNRLLGMVKLRCSYKKEKSELELSLKRVLEIASNVDYAAEVYTDNTQQRFVNKTYEADWTPIEKFLYRTEKRLPGSVDRIIFNIRKELGMGTLNVASVVSNK